MNIRILSSKTYPENSRINYGDCILIDDNTNHTLIIYDCGHEEHAKQVIKYMDTHNYSKATFILSHNDSDHFNGLQTLLDADKIDKIITTLLLKYVDQILDEIDDNRKTRNSLKNQILDKYDNIAKLSGYPIKDYYEINPQITSNVKLVGPSFEYMISAVAKHLDTTEGDTVDQESPYNATSLLVEVAVNGKKLLLTGDCAFSPIENLVTDYDYIQLPHHGKVKQAEKIFEKNIFKYYVEYYISDNTGNSNGGSDKLDTTGHIVYNTKILGNLSIIDKNYTQNHSLIPPIIGSYGE